MSDEDYDNVYDALLDLANLAIEAAKHRQRLADAVFWHGCCLVVLMILVAGLYVWG